MSKRTTALLCATLLTAPVVQAHSLWINLFESHAHQPPHAMLSLGWGHAMPMDDLLNSVNGRIELERFEVIDPALNKTALALPAAQPAEATTNTTNFAIFAGDLAVQKLALTKDSQPGIYQIGAVSKESFYTQYVDKNGRERMQLKPRDALDDIDKVLMSVKFQAFAKSFLTVGEWQTPKPLGHALEIIPRSDLSDLHVGDLVEFEVLFNGQPLNASAKSIEYITAHSPSFGQSDNFGLFSYIMDGKAQFRVQSAGQWMVSVNHKDDVSADGPLKDLVGKANQVYAAASLTFTVK